MAAILQDKSTPGFRQAPEAFVHMPLEKDPQLMPGLFDAEIQLVLDSAKRFGERVTNIALDTPAGFVGWVFDDSRPWANLFRV